MVDKGFQLTGHGCISFWGITPAVDVVKISEHFLPAVGGNKRSDDEPINVLISSAGDCRHVLKILANERGARSRRKINIYVLDATIENVARDLLLLAVGLESPTILGLREKTKTFLEVFGNLKLGRPTKDYLSRKVPDLIRLITNDPVNMKGAGMLDISDLKYKDRDALEELFKSWLLINENLDLTKCWDARMRRDLGTRYDSRQGAFDWDFSMNLADVEGKIITSPFYHRWRETGLAFGSEDDFSVSEPNLTIVSNLCVSQKQTSHKMRGYWGDMMTSPYVSFGLGKDVQKYRKTFNDIETIPSAKISEMVLMDYFHAILTGSTDRLDESTDAGVIITEIDNSDFVEEINSTIWMDRYKIIFLPPMPYSKIAEKSKYHRLFDIVYIGGHVLDSVSSLKATLHPPACVIFETPKYLIGKPKTRCSDYYKSLTAKLLQNDVHFQVCGEYDKMDDLFVTTLTEC